MHSSQSFYSSGYYSYTRYSKFYDISNFIQQIRYICTPIFLAVTAASYSLIRQHRKKRNKNQDHIQLQNLNKWSYRKFKYLQWHYFPNSFFEGSCHIAKTALLQRGGGTRNRGKASIFSYTVFSVEVKAKSFANEAGGLPVHVCWINALSRGGENIGDPAQGAKFYGATFSWTKFQSFRKKYIGNPAKCSISVSNSHG